MPRKQLDAQDVQAVRCTSLGESSGWEQSACSKCMFKAEKLAEITEEAFFPCFFFPYFFPSLLKSEYFLTKVAEVGWLCAC